ncbi:MAG: hypothetical protein IH951_13965 [Bacteroidetes bacterium]|nr:hypothetical protein [Bacteroidota bacterium]
MIHDRSAHRSYSEKEIGELIQRATELHEEEIGASEHSLSLKEIEHIASELGVPPEHLQKAALELEDRRNSDKSFSFWGAPFVIDQTRVVNETMTEEQWEDIVLELRRFSGRTGKISELGRARQWMHFVGEGEDGFNFNKTQVTVRPGDGQTSIQIRKHYGGVAIMMYLGAFLWSIFFTFILLHGEGLSDLVNFAIGAGIGLGTLPVVRVSLSLWARRQKERLKRLADLLHRTLSASSSPVLANEPATELIEIPEMDEPERITREIRRGVRG